ncbi:hypothetical protein [Xanthobacter aminoxidans]|uniref:hypothetical protein n=1 Tax=Xanthobacter aminoxidans TaxID=186280 RepID=UPI002022C46D|nr:hypothetical protein [Xanthobacter aminoxidans]MCL8385527.1 hypothetical protein [Xanthobacter aminoxidans]
MNAIHTQLTDEEAAILATMSEKVTSGLAPVTQAFRDACGEHSSPQLLVAISVYIAHIAGQVAANAEFVAYNTGASKDLVETLCACAFREGRDAAFIEQKRLAGFTIVEAPTTGAAQ